MSKEIPIDKLQNQIPKWHLVTDELPSVSSSYIVACIKGEVSPKSDEKKADQPLAIYNQISEKICKDFLEENKDLILNRIEVELKEKMEQLLF